jgi:hypothetical protein
MDVRKWAGLVNVAKKSPNAEYNTFLDRVRWGKEAFEEE